MHGKIIPERGVSRITVSVIILLLLLILLLIIPSCGGGGGGSRAPTVTMLTVDVPMTDFVVPSVTGATLYFAVSADPNSSAYIILVEPWPL